jgi:hypothetical protein
LFLRTIVAAIVRYLRSMLTLTGGRDADPVARFGGVLLECHPNFLVDDGDGVGCDATIEFRILDRLLSGGTVVRELYVRNFGDEMEP